MEVTFTARKKPRSFGLINLEILGGQDKVDQFFKKHLEWEEKKGEERFLTVTLESHYRKRSVQQNRLERELCKRIALVDLSDPDEIHEAAKAITYPTLVNDKGVYYKKPGKMLSTVEFAAHITFLIAEAIDRGADIRDIWILWTEWRYGQEKDPMEGTYRDFSDYREKHPLCEACGVFLGETSHGAHIVPVSQRGSDEDWNRLILCVHDHIGIQHRKGWAALLKVAPHLRGKVTRAFSRQGYDGGLSTKEITNAE